MSAQPEAVAADLPEGAAFDPVRGLVVRGLVARQIADHPVIRRPNRHFATCTFDHLSDNTMLAMHLARLEPGGTKCDHRHFDETVVIIVSGSGWAEFRQAEDAEKVRVDWTAGDLVVIPCNAWHIHHNASPTDHARQLSFRTTRLMNAILHGTRKEYDRSETLYNLDAKLYNRFADQRDYFAIREELRPGVIRTNHVRSVVDEPLPPDDPAVGDGVAVQRYVMGGQRLLDMALVGIRSGGRTHPRRGIAEEGTYVLRGTGRTDVWDEAGRRATVEWSAGDLVAPPLGAWRQHTATGSEDVRLLSVSNAVIERALGTPVGDAGRFDSLPTRFADRVEPQWTSR